MTTLDEILSEEFDGRTWSKLKPAEKFLATWLSEGYSEITKEHKFHPTRRWRFDFAWPSLKVAVEVHGFGYGHQAQQMLANDCEKQRAAAELGWLVLPFTTRCLGSKDKCSEAVEQVCRVLSWVGLLLHIDEKKLTIVD